MTSAALYATAATDDHSAHSGPLREGDTVRCWDNPDDCNVIGTWNDWLWLHSLHPATSRRSRPALAPASL
jgi:hypothetical protein